VYLVTVALSVAATVLLIAPVSLHRGLFRQHARRVLVSAGHRFALAGLALLGLAVTGVTLLIFDVVTGPTAGIVAGVCTFVGLATLWGVLPWVQRNKAENQDRGTGPLGPAR
jgi:low temperature requirement protein LtrA